jgi:hypothetical protein
MTSTPFSKPRTEIGPLRTLLATAVDHAGLFPPAGLNMSAAVAAFDAHRRGEHAWMLGSFVVPGKLVGELAEALGRLAVEVPPMGGAWPLGVIVESVAEGASVTEDVRRRHGDLLRVAALEVRPLESDAIRAGHGASAAGGLDDVTVFYEVPLDERMEARLDAVAVGGASAKVRTGGVTAEAFPTTAALVRFVRECAERDVPFKATAGLHHAFRGRYPLTYQPDSASGTMHGFLGLAVVAALIHEHDIGEREAATVLAAGAEDLEVGEDRLSWRGHLLTADEITRARETFFRSFGSCSFEEPVAELKALGLV